MRNSKECINSSIEEKKTFVLLCTYLLNKNINNNNNNIFCKWSKEFIKLITLEFLKLPNFVYDGMLPLLENNNESNINIINTTEDPIYKTFNETLSMNHLWLIIEDLLLHCTSISIGYDSRIRILLRSITKIYNIEWKDMIKKEKVIGNKISNMINVDKNTSLINNDTMARQQNTSNYNWQRGAKIGLATVLGGTLLAVTGGLAAPAIGASLTALGGAGVVIGGAVVSTSGVAVTSAFFGVAGAGLVGYKTDKRTSGIKEFTFKIMKDEELELKLNEKRDKKRKKDSPNGKGMNIFICISGWVQNLEKQNEDFIHPWGRKPISILKKDLNDISLKWSDIISGGDQYCLKWEKDILYKFGLSMDTFITTNAINFAYGEVLKRTAFATLYAAAALPTALWKAASYIDGEWTMAMNRADKAGKLLATILIRREHGYRPVTLMGYSMGARLIFSCLNELESMSKKNDNDNNEEKDNKIHDVYGIIENIVLLGAPIPATKVKWEKCKKLVAGRFINGYSSNDWMLGIMYRYQGWVFTSAGIGPVDVEGIENIDLSSIITGHKEYKDKICEILKLISLEN